MAYFAILEKTEQTSTATETLVTLILIMYLAFVPYADVRFYAATTNSHTQI